MFINMYMCVCYHIYIHVACVCICSQARGVRRSAKRCLLNLGRQVGKSTV